DADAKAKAAKKAAGPAKYVIAVGKALTSKKGMLCAGDEVRPEYLRGDGEEALNAHVKAGTVVKE
ncbi:MAG: hypothetical protein KAR06_04575, partial [Deltaproteobacteria bacterium]|nr:hypothetical protein [Deltaproteobacteria bacterium]